MILQAPNTVFKVVKSILPAINLYSLFKIRREWIQGEYSRTKLSNHQLGYVDFRRLEAVLGCEHSIAFGDVSEARIENLIKLIKLISVKNKRNALEIIGLLEIIEEMIQQNIKKQIRKGDEFGEILDVYSEDTSVISNFSSTQSRRSLPLISSEF